MVNPPQLPDHLWDGVTYQEYTLKQATQGAIRVLWNAAKVVDPKRVKFLAYRDYPKGDKPSVQFRLDTINPVAGNPVYRQRHIDDNKEVYEHTGNNFSLIITIVAYEEDTLYFLGNLFRYIKSTEFYNETLTIPAIGITSISNITPTMAFDDVEWDERAEMKITMTVQTNEKALKKSYQVEKVNFSINLEQTRPYYSVPLKRKISKDLPHIKRLYKLINTDLPKSGDLTWARKW